MAKLKHFSVVLPLLGKWSNLTSIFQLGWNHQLVLLKDLKMIFYCFIMGVIKKYTLSLHGRFVNGLWKFQLQIVFCVANRPLSLILSYLNNFVNVLKNTSNQRSRSLNFIWFRSSIAVLKKKYISIEEFTLRRRLLMPISSRCWFQIILYFHPLFR